MQSLKNYYTNIPRQRAGFHLVDIVPSASCCFLLVFYFAEYQYQTESKRSGTFWRIFMDQKTQLGPKKYQRGARTVAQPTWVRLGSQARLGRLCPPQWPPAPPLHPINTQIFQKP